MGTWLKVLLGLSPALAIVLYFVMQEYQKSDVQMAEKHLETTMQINTFNRDFELGLSEMADSAENKRMHLVFADQHASKNEKILAEKEEAERKRKALEAKSEENLKDMEDIFGEDPDLNISDKEMKF